jgi:ATP-binding cassette subfamily F protein uup
MLEPADVLLLDEPTNDLDIPTLEILEESLLEFPGALVLISHDRLMLDRVCTSILSLASNSDSQIFADYTQWQLFQEQQKEAKPAPSKKVQPPQPAAALPPSQKKLSYKEEQEFKQIEQKILEQEELVAKLQKALEAPEIASDAERLQQACNELHEAQHLLERQYDRWQELESRYQK